MTTKMTRKKVRRNSHADLERRIGDASILLYDYDGYYDPKTKKGNAEALASLIDDAFTILQGSHWKARNHAAKKNDSLRIR